MGISFRKSFRIGKNTRINVSKRGGIGVSTGVKGMRISKNSQGLRLSLGGKGIYYTKWFFTKKSKHKKNKKLTKVENVDKVRNTISEENEEVKKVVNPETDFERVPTEDEQALLLYLGNKERNYLLYTLSITLIGLAIFCLIEQSLLSYVLVAFNFCLLLLYLFKSNINYCVMGINHSIKLFERNKFDKTYKILKKCLVINSKNKKALILMMFTTFKLEKYEETLEYIKRYEKQHKPLEVMYFMEGFSCSESGKYQEGIDAIEKVYSEEDDIKFAKYKILGDCYLGLQDLDKAISWYEELPVKENNMNENIMEYKYALGKALLLSGNKKRAFTYLSKVYDYKVDYKDVKELMNQM